MKAILEKINSLENPTTSNVNQFQHLIDGGFVTAEKLYSGPLKLHDGSFRLSLTDKGRKIIEP